MTGFIISVFFGFVPMLAFAAILYWLDRFEREPKILLGVVFTWGALVAAGLAFLINTILGTGVYLITGSERLTEFATGTFLAPPIEETLKGFIVLVIFLMFRREFDSVLDGIVFAGIAALGFAATENTYYIYNYGYLENGLKGILQLVFIRVILVGWQHPFYTAFIGIGLAAARFQKSVWLGLLVTVAGWGAAVLTHSLHNIISGVVSGISGWVLGTTVDWIGWFILLVFIFWMINRERKWIKKHLRVEADRGTITPGQYRTAYSFWAQDVTRLIALFSGNFKATHRFYQLTSELAYKKEVQLRMGEDPENSAFIKRTQDELARLSPAARFLHEINLL